MINAYLIGNDYQTKDVIMLTNGYANIDVYQPSTFELDFLRDIGEIGDFVTIIDNGNPKFTGLIEKTDKANGFRVSGTNIKQILVGLQYFVINNTIPIDRIPIDSTVYDLVVNQLTLCFPQLEITVFSSLSEEYRYSTQLRMTSVFDLLNNATNSNNLNYQIYLMGNNQMRVYLNENRHLENEIKLITDITHSVLEEIQNTREFYNQIIGLGAGEEEERDYYFIDESNGNTPKCYVYDLRESITHDELVKRTEEKYSTLTKDHSATFKILKNNLYVFGEDYTIGDYVSFANDEGLIFNDIISTIEINIDDGKLTQDYEVTIGRYRGTLTDKINELKEGGIR